MNPKKAMSPKQEARQLRIDTYNIDGKMRVPIDVREIASALNIEIQEQPLPNSVAGFILKEENHEHPIIYLNENDGEQRQRFTIAHELGHYVLERGNKRIAYVDKRNKLATTGTDPEERWCNGFAAELIMPESVVKKYWAEGWTFEKIRERLNVSKAALENRLYFLGLV